ncbi:uncharacterized protein LOC117807895 isoform X4 [Notolabrus celidotus]|uniref:uncharacterized protein LOC117807895 isoform X4 n=1 Tax=Notolabrus celidotus TaxID=1203425 RepID=UPI00149015F4|nr:uncharacterized protein LOC117807895 isoform X4 [Notolabrus celidotus]
MRPAVSRVQWILSSTVAKETERQDHLLHRGGDDGPGEDGLSVPESGSWVDSNLCFVVLISVGVGPQTSVCMELRQQQDREQVKEVPVQGGSDPGCPRRGDDPGSFVPRKKPPRAEHASVFRIPLYQGLRVRSGSRWLNVVCQVLSHSGDGRRRVRRRDVLEGARGSKN